MQIRVISTIRYVGVDCETLLTFDSDEIAPPIMTFRLSDCCWKLNRTQFAELLLRHRPKS